VSALIAVGFGLSAVLRAHGEETAGRAEPVLATPTARSAWLGSHVAVALAGGAAAVLAGAAGTGITYAVSISDPAPAWRTLEAAVAYLPATWLAIAVAVAGVGLVPRLAAPMAWTYLGYLSLVAFLGDSFDLPGWARSLSPLDHTPRTPLEEVAVLPLAVMVALAVVAVAAGLAGLRSRDIETV